MPISLLGPEGLEEGLAAGLINKNNLQKGSSRGLQMIAEGLDIAVVETCLTKQVLHSRRDVGHIHEWGNIVNDGRSSLLFCFQGGQGLLPQILLQRVSSQPVGNFFSDMLAEQFDRGLNKSVMLVLDDCFDVMDFD